MDRIAGFPPYKAASILCEFGAKYLPLVVDRYIAGNFDLYPSTSMLLPMYKLYNPYSYLVFRLCGRPYFVKYIRSKHPIAAQGKYFVGVLAERLVAVIKLCKPEILQPATRHRPSFHEPLTRVFKVLASILAFTPSARYQVSDDDLDTILDFIQTCKRAGIEPLGEVGEHLGISLLGPPEFLKAAPGFRRGIQGRDECGLPGCDNVIDLKACARRFTM
ncbi:hypothetical protein BDN72DRAFT_297639 [Pluteus cervinus]|uniref:Uncharacterized protein n=1 Tax=Pluteus cervinus TaxID=181527 RepID=A0ACD3B3Y1_9AGAR|nr:hypothetical protein BDN72DRAFT_297639 [Pluteus cervinus]